MIMRWTTCILLTVSLAACKKSDNLYDASGNFEAQETIISSESTGKIIQLAVEEGTYLTRDSQWGTLTPHSFI